jgi:hypothetical protein
LTGWLLVTLSSEIVPSAGAVMFCKFCVWNCDVPDTDSRIFPFCTFTVDIWVWADTFGRSDVLTKKYVPAPPQTTTTAKTTAHFAPRFMAMTIFLPVYSMDLKCIGWLFSRHFRM